MAAAIRDPAELCRRLELPPASAAAAAARSFPTLVPEAFVDRMRRGDPADPLLRQVLPIAAECEPAAGFSHDPLAERDCALTPGLLCKYRGRALLVTTGACAVHCRYCFRRHFAYDALPRGRAWWAPACRELAADPDCREVLLSGGDPLVLPDSILAGLLADLQGLPQLRRLRIHSRLPVVLPDRIDDGFLHLVGGLRLPLVLVLHANHANEVDEAVVAACQRLRAAGVHLLNQAVLLRGINDSVAAQAALAETLFDAGVLPYYLHQLDRVAGAAHFAVSDSDATAIWWQLHARLPGYLLPRLVREEPGAAGKTPLL